MPNTIMNTARSFDRACRLIACAPARRGFSPWPLRRARNVPLRARLLFSAWLRRTPLAMLAAIAMVIAGASLATQGVWMHGKAKLAQWLLERAFSETLATGADVKPWSWADTWPIARIQVPRLTANAIVLHGSSGQALAFGPGHVETTPHAGSPGTAVYSAHRDTHFRFLRDVVVNDEIVVTLRDGRSHRFRVTHTSVVHWDRSGIDPFADGHHLILATCWPLDSKFPGPMRYLVHADMVDDGESAASASRFDDPAASRVREPFAQLPPSRRPDLTPNRPRR